MTRRHQDLETRGLWHTQPKLQAQTVADLEGLSCGYRQQGCKRSTRAAGVQMMRPRAQDARHKTTVLAACPDGSGFCFGLPLLCPYFFLS